MTLIFSEKGEYDKSLESHLNVINQQTDEIQSLRGKTSFPLFFNTFVLDELKSKDETVSRLQNVNVVLSERLRSVENNAEQVLNVGRSARH